MLFVVVVVVVLLLFVCLFVCLFVVVVVIVCLFVVVVVLGGYLSKMDIIKCNVLFSANELFLHNFQREQKRDRILTSMRYVR